MDGDIAAAAGEVDGVGRDAVIAQVVAAHPETVRVFAKHGLGCVTCQIAEVDTLERGAAAHRVPLEPLLADLATILRDPTAFGSEHTGGLAPVSDAARRVERKIDTILAIASGKGGVGKSVVTASLAIGLNRAGYRVGILDADITGPSIPTIFGLTASPADAWDGKIIPVISEQGIKIISSQFFTADPMQAIIWRGPLISQLIKRMYEQTLWGELDYLLLDMPPGTSDAQITIYQALPVNGTILVSSPQLLSTNIVRRAISLTAKMRAPIVGVVENMSYLRLTAAMIGGGSVVEKNLNVFGRSRADDLAVLAGGVPVLARLPIEPRIAGLIDAGRLEQAVWPDMTALTQTFLAEAPSRLRRRRVSLEEEVADADEKTKIAD